MSCCFRFLIIYIGLGLLYIPTNRDAARPRFYSLIPLSYLDADIKYVKITTSNIIFFVRHTRQTQNG